MRSNRGTGTKVFGALVALAVLLALGLSLGYFSYIHMLKPVSSPQDAREVTITVPPGASSRQIAEMMSSRGLIRNQVVFRIYAAYKGLDSHLQAGDYNFNTGLSTPEVIARLAQGQTSSISFTIPEGFTLSQIVDRLAAKGLINRDKFMDLAAHGQFNYDFLKGLPAGPNRLEGYLFPDTYRVTKNTTEEQIINMMLERFAREITPEFKTKAAKEGLTVNQAVTLASIVEREAKVDDERPKVAAVFLNRLKKGWKLESCATVQYALGKPKARLFDKDLKVASPYNTYIHKGLPPGPIASPGEPSLEAAVNPAKVDYMFFVVFEDGKHIFSRTLQEHNRNKAAYLKKLKEAKQ